MDMITLGTNLLIAVTLIYCIILERRIRHFRKQEAVFKNLIGEVSRSTLAAQSAVSALKLALSDANKVQTSPHYSSAEHLVVTRDLKPDPVLVKPQTKMPSVTMTAADLARHFAEIRLAGPTS
jgi:hypothetical protein